MKRKKKRKMRKGENGDSRKGKMSTTGNSCYVMRGDREEEGKTRSRSAGQKRGKKEKVKGRRLVDGLKTGKGKGN